MPKVSQSTPDTYNSDAYFRNIGAADATNNTTTNPQGQPQFNFGKITPYPQTPSTSLASKITRPMKQVTHQLGYLAKIKEASATTMNKKLCAKAFELTYEKFRKNITIENFLKHVPKAIKLHQVQAIAAQAMAGIENRYIPDGCYIRALQVNDQLAAQFGKKNCLNVIISCSNSETLEVKKNGLYQGVAWSHHIAAAVQADDGHLYIFDPATNNQQALRLDQWMDNFGFPGDITIQISEKNSTNCPGLLRASQFRSQGQELACIYSSNVEKNIAELTPTQTRPSYPPAHFALQLNNESPKRFSFSTQASAAMLSNLLQVRYDTLKIETPNPQLQTTLFTENSPQGTITQLSKADVLAKLAALGINKIEILQVPCNLDNPSSFKILERTPFEDPIYNG